MSSSTPDYFAYLLRVWRVQTEGGHIWRASLEPAGRRERHAFGQMEELFAFLQHECAVVAPQTVAATEVVVAATPQVPNPIMTRKPE